MTIMIEIARKLALKRLSFLDPYAWRIFRLFVDWQFSYFMRQRFGLFYRGDAEFRMPPKELYVKVGATTPAEFERAVRSPRLFEDSYRGLGRYTVLRFLQLLEKAGGNVRTLGTVFELGCGTGRLSQHLQSVEGLEVIGSDLNPDMVAWCQAHLPAVKAFQNQVAPPLTFLDDGSVDLVYCYSVFTHIPLNLQVSWLKEVHRVLRPGGFLICSIAGWRLQKQFLSKADAETLRRTGQFESTSADTNVSLATQVGGSGWDVYQTRSEVVRVFGGQFVLRDYVNVGQDVLVLQKAAS